MFKRIILAALAVVALAGFATVTPAQAAAERATAVAPITCSPEEDSCVLAYVANAGNGYVMARQESDVAPYTWVRLTLVPGWNNSAIAPITCKYSTSCVLDFVGYTAGGGHAFWRGAQASGSVWVTLTM